VCTAAVVATPTACNSNDDGIAYMAAVFFWLRVFVVLHQPPAAVLARRAPC
jgi:hypothetical protein